MKSSDYWKLRFEQLEQAQSEKGTVTVVEIEKQYRQAQKQIEGQISYWYQRFANNNKITLAEARQWLKGADLKEFKWDVQDYIKYGQANALNGEWMKELENASAKFHISKLEALKIQTQQSLEVMYKKQHETVAGAMSNLFESSYYHTAYELQKGFHIGWDIVGLNQSQIEKVLAKPWAVDGKNFSERIWGNKKKLILEIHSELTQNIMLGADPQKVIDSLAKKMNTSKHNAGRLVMTEEAYFSSVAQKECFEDLDVEQYEIVATIDSHTSDICQNLDGKVFAMKDFQPGVTAPPFHVFCRSTTVPYFDDDFEDVGKRAARNEKTGKTYYIPDNMNYQEWKKTFVDGTEDDNRLKTVDKANKNVTMESEKEVIRDLLKLKSSGMADDAYAEYLDLINNHTDSSIRHLYSKYGDKIDKIKKSANGGAYAPNLHTIDFSFPQYDDMNKYDTLAHEYGHFFDAEVTFVGIHFKEIEAIRSATELDTLFKSVASSSDEFLEAIRKDKDHIRSIFSRDQMADLIAHNASSGVQDVIDGLFTKSRIKWGHGEKYYNRRYAAIESIDKTVGSSKKKKLQQVYKDLGFDASNQAKVKSICRQYEAASEAWANIISAEICGGESLEYVKKYLPNSYKAMLEILKGVI